GVVRGRRAKLRLSAEQLVKLDSRENERPVALRVIRRDRLAHVVAVAAVAAEAEPPDEALVRHADFAVGVDGDELFDETVEARHGDVLVRGVEVALARGLR